MKQLHNFGFFICARTIAFVLACAYLAVSVSPAVAQGVAAPGSKLPPPGANVVIASADCNSAKIGNSIPPSAIGEPVGGVMLAEPAWVAATNTAPAYCRVEGSIAPVDKSSTAKPINFRVVLPASWNHRAAQFGGGGMNGMIPNLIGADPGSSGASVLQRGFVTYGSDSGHTMTFPPGFPGFPPGAAPPGGPGGPPAGMPAGPPPGLPRAFMSPAGQDWALNDEAIRNLGYQQMKKTHDAAFVVIDRVYGGRPRFNYYIGGSQGGREGLTVAQRYPADYDGVAANVPIVSFSSLVLGTEFIRIHEKPSANWLPPTKVNAISTEFVRQCDALDGLADGIMNNYMACRALFDVKQGKKDRHPWAAKRCPNGIDPNPDDTSAGACLTDGQISTLEVTYSRYRFATPLAHGARSFGMWLPNTDPSGSGLIADIRFKGQEGAAADAPVHALLGAAGVVGFLMRDLAANPLDYVEGGPLNERRKELSAWLDATDPDLSAFYKRGGKLIIAIGTNDTLASPGAQLDYYQSLLDKMGRPTVDKFARLFVMPQAGHGLSGTNYGVDGMGRTIPTAPVPNTYDRLALLFDWVENNVAPPKAVTVTAGAKSLPLCSYPEYPRYTSGSPDTANSFTCRTP